MLVLGQKSNRLQLRSGRSGLTMPSEYRVQSYLCEFERVRHPIDIAIISAALWLLGSMVLDFVTPKELTIYMIAAATAPAVIGTALAYYLRFPRIDFVFILTMLWLFAALAIEWISPVPLPVFLIGAAIAPTLIIGAILLRHHDRSGERPG
jgi:hypothetical protein